MRTDGTKVEPGKLDFSALFSSYWAIVSNMRFIVGCGALGLLAIPVMSWIDMSPVLLVKNLGLSLLEYCLWQIPIFGAVMAGNLVLSFLAKKHDIKKTSPYLSGYAMAAVLPAFVTVMLIVFILRQNLTHLSDSKE